MRGYQLYAGENPRWVWAASLRPQQVSCCACLLSPSSSPPPPPPPPLPLLRWPSVPAHTWVTHGDPQHRRPIKKGYQHCSLHCSPAEMIKHDLHSLIVTLIVSLEHLIEGLMLDQCKCVHQHWCTITLQLCIWVVCCLANHNSVNDQCFECNWGDSLPGHSAVTHLPTTTSTTSPT